MDRTTVKKKLIEVAMPLELINDAAMKEKSNPFLKGHPRSLHQWWARRPLPTCRAVLFAQLVDDPSCYPHRFATKQAIDAERARLFSVIEELVRWDNSTNLEVLSRAHAEIVKSCGSKIPAVYDPFSGGGAIPFEAQRLGLAAYGSDLNPVAVMIGKAMIEFPSIFSGSTPVHGEPKGRISYVQTDGLAEDIRHYGRLLRELTEKKIGKHFPTVKLPTAAGGGNAPVIAWVWTRTVPSPDPAFSSIRVPIASTFVLSTKKGKEAWIEPEINKDTGEIRYCVRTGANKSAIEAASRGTKFGRGASFQCILSGTAITPEYVKDVGSKTGYGYDLMAIVADGKRRRVYLGPDSEHVKAASEIELGEPSSLTLSRHPQYMGVSGYGLHNSSDLFTPRQLLALDTLCKGHNEIVEKAIKDAVRAGFADDNIPLRDGGRGARAYGEAIGVYLAFAIDKLADYNNSLCGWNNANENISHLFNRHAIPMMWDFVEGNIFGPMLDFGKLCDGVASGLAIAGLGTPGTEFQSDAVSSSIDAVNCLVSTDPPYYDNVPYADISDFFYVWMRATLGSTFPDLFSTVSVPKMDELVADRVRHGSANEADSFFLDRMTSAIRNMIRLSSPDLPTTIYYAFKQSEIIEEGVSSTGWATFLEAVLNAGFSINATWPVRTERTTRMRAIGSNALASSVVLVCRKRELSAEVVSRAEFVRALKRELPVAIADLQSVNIAPADMPQSAIGPGMAVFSRYRSVLESDDRAMTVKTALQLINRELDEYLGGIEGDFDVDTRFAITWFAQFGNQAGEYGIANSIAQARGISVESVKHAGIVDSAAGLVKIIARSDLDDDWSPDTDQHLTIWECCQHLIRSLESDGEQSASDLLRSIGTDKADAVKDLAYCLYGICEKRSDAKEAMAYNALIAVWSELTRQAASNRSATNQQQSQLDL